LSISILFSYVLLGLTLAAPIGPVNSARLDKGIKNGFWHAWIVGAGSMIADAVFMLLVYVGMVRFLDIPAVQIFLWLFGGFVLIYSGIESMTSMKSFSLESVRKRDSLTKCFFIGFLMSISSPLSILFWLGIYGSILAKTASENGTGDLLIYSSMIFLGLTIWDIFVALLTTSLKKYFNSNILIIISVLSGLSLLCFGSYFGFQGIKALFG
jgi:threonine/homoserine/homoserine lactone efflux protein